MTLKPINRIHRKFAVILFIHASFLLSVFTPGQAQSGEAVSIVAQAGFDGYCKDGHWIPIHIRLENNGDDIEGQVEVQVKRNNASESNYTHPITLPTVSHKEITLYVYPEGYTSKYDVVLTAGSQEVAKTEVRLTCLNTGDALYGVIADSATAFNALANIDPPNGTAYVAQLGIHEIPDRTEALKALDALFISDTDTGVLTIAQRQALSGWVASGGKLIVTGGPSWQKTSAGMGDLLPLDPNSSETVSSLQAMQAFSASEESLSGSAVVATGVLSSRAEILVSENEVPLLLRKQTGFGEVYYLTLDPANSPLRNWDGLEDFYRMLLTARQDRPGWADGFTDWDTAASAATTIPSLALPSTLFYCGFLGFYILAIGPVNYLVLRRLKRRELAWVTIPGLVIVFSVFAYLIGNQLRGKRPILNRTAIVQVWPDIEQAQVHGLLGLFSPNRSTYQLDIEGGFLPHPIPLTYGSSITDWTFQEGNPTTTIPNIRVEIGGINGLAVEGVIPAPVFTHSLSLVIDSRGVSLEGEVTNTSSLILEDAVLLLPGSAKSVGTFRPNDTFTVTQMSLNAMPANEAGGSSYNPLGGPIMLPPIMGYYYPFANDTVIQEIMGQRTLYDDKESFQRFSLLSAAIQGRDGNGGRGGGIYLAGWTNDSPIPASVNGKRFNTFDSTLYLIALTPEINLLESQLTLPPSMFTWSTISVGLYGYASPYQMDVSSQEGFELMFSLAQPIPYQSIETLTLHLNSYVTSGPSGLEISLWDHTSQSWVELSAINWGDHDIPNPERYVGPTGDILVQVRSSSGFVQIESLDFTLVVER